MQSYAKDPADRLPNLEPWVESIFRVSSGPTSGGSGFPTDTPMREHWIFPGQLARPHASRYPDAIFLALEKSGYDKAKKNTSVARSSRAVKIPAVVSETFEVLEPSSSCCLTLCAVLIPDIDLLDHLRRHWSNSPYKAMTK